MTTTLTIALQTLASQTLAALINPGAYSASLTGGQGHTVTQLRALCRRGFADRVTVMGCIEGYVITDAGLQHVAKYVRGACADVQSKAKPQLASPYAGISYFAQQEMAGAAEMLARLS